MHPPTLGEIVSLQKQSTGPKPVHPMINVMRREGKLHTKVLPQYKMLVTQ